MRLVNALRTLPHNALDDEGLRRLVSRTPTLERLMASDLELLARECGLDHGKLRQLTVELALARTAGAAATARELHATHLDQHALLATGVGALDALLRGGLQTGEVLELAGPPGSGKTTLCLTACAAQASAAGSVMYVDTTNGFRPRRLHELLRQRWPKHQRDELLERRLRVRGVTGGLVPLVQQLEALDVALDPSSGAHDDFHAALRLLVVDCVFAAAVAEGGGAVSKSAAGAQLARLQQVLRSLATRHRLAVLVTNLSVLEGRRDDEGGAGGVGGGGGGGATHKPALGMAWQHTAHVRLMLREVELAPAPHATGGGAAAGGSGGGRFGVEVCVHKSTLSARGVQLGECTVVDVSEASAG